jgi:hypothetical protein
MPSGAGAWPDGARTIDGRFRTGNRRGWIRLHGRQVGQKARELLPDNLVAFADARFQAWSIQHRDMSSVVSNQPGTLQETCTLRSLPH